MKTNETFKQFAKNCVINYLAPGILENGKLLGDKVLCNTEKTCNERNCPRLAVIARKKPTPTKASS